MFHHNQSNIIYELNEIFSHFFFNTDISVHKQDCELNFSMYDPYILLEERISRNFDLGPSFYVMSKRCLVYFLFMKMITRIYIISLRYYSLHLDLKKNMFKI